MKIGILTLFHGNYNWGGVLQGYALKSLIEAQFPDTQADLLIYHGRNIVYDRKIKQILQYSPIDILRKTAKKFSSKRNAGYKKKLVQRYALFRQFMEEYTTNPVVYNDETLIEAAKMYDCIISGSDQVWNPNVGCAGFFQQMISDECKKIAYAASIARDDLSNHEKNVMIPLIEKFDAVSVRERTAKRILEQYVKNGISITEVLDPVMMLSKHDWELLAHRSSQLFKGRYALAFFFSESLPYRKRITEYCKKNNLTLKFIPYAKGEHIASDEKGDAERIYDVGPYEFVNLFQHAECVFTDSFHGSVFSIIFQKQFCVFERDKKSKVSKNSRLYDLLEKFQLSDLMIRDVSALDEVMCREINYDEINKQHEQFRIDSLKFLKKELETRPVQSAPKASHVAEIEKGMCNGCESCVAQCPKNCISMRQDDEGFYFPSVDESVCVKCGHCLNACSSKMRIEPRLIPKAYIGFHNNQEVRANSSSGGLFYALAEVILQEGGCVYGAAYIDGFEVRHCRISNFEELHRLMTSKYVQSRMGDVFTQVLKDLEKGHQVLFSGTPCQVAAMHGFISRKQMRGNLILVDFVCHGVPSPGVWQSYVKYLEEINGSEMVAVSFRDKNRGWHDYHFNAVFQNSHINETHDLNAYMRSFLSDKNIRRSCYHCAFKDANYYSDITLGDAWKIEKDYPDWADDRGTSFFVVRTDEGQNLLAKVKNFFEYRETGYDRWKMYNPSLVMSTVQPQGRTPFFADYHSMNPQQFWKVQKRVPLKQRVRYFAKRVVKIIGIEKKLRNRM